MWLLRPEIMCPVPSLAIPFPFPADQNVDTMVEVGSQMLWMAEEQAQRDSHREATISAHGHLHSGVHKTEINPCLI